MLWLTGKFCLAKAVARLERQYRWARRIIQHRGAVNLRVRESPALVNRQNVHVKTAGDARDATTDFSRANNADWSCFKAPYPATRDSRMCRFLLAHYRPEYDEEESKSANIVLQCDMGAVVGRCRP